MAKGKAKPEPAEDDKPDVDTFDEALGTVIDELQSECNAGTMGAKIKASEHGATFNPIELVPGIIAFLEWLRKFRRGE